MLSNHPLAVAHRGAPEVATENTLASIDAAIEAGADWVEIDVKLTSDGVPVLLHDYTLDRIWGIPQPVSEVDHASLPPGIPTLHEALNEIKGRGVRLLIDVTGVTDATASMHLVNGLSRQEETAWTGNTEALAKVRVHHPGAIITMTWDSLTLPGEDIFDAVLPDYFNQSHDLLTPDTISLMHARGLMVSTFTVDDPDRMRWLIAHEVDAITSNRIGTLVAVVSGS